MKTTARTNADSGSDSSGATRRRTFRIAKIGYPGQFAGMVGLMLLIAATQWLMQGPLHGVSGALPVVAGAGCALVVAAIGLWWRELYLYLAGATAATVVLTLVGALTAAGTVIVQDAAPAELSSRWGALAGPLRFLGWDDVFHSWAFIFLLILVALMSTVTVIRRRRTMLRWRHFGLLMTHTSIVLVLVGGGIGALRATKGMIHLEVGQALATYLPNPTPRHPGPVAQPLDFSVRLDSFELDEYRPEYKIYTYEVDEGGESRVVAAEDPKVGATVGLTGEGRSVQVRVLRVMKRAVPGGGYGPTADGRGGTVAAKVELLSRGAGMGSVWLAADQPAVRGPGDRFRIRFLARTPTPSAARAMAQSEHGGDIALLLLLVADPPERLTVWHGAITERAPIRWGKPFTPIPDDPQRIQIVAGEPLRHAVKSTGWHEARAGPLNPAIEVALTFGGRTVHHILTAKGGDPIPLSPGRVLAYREKPGKIRNYESTVSILKAGRVVHSQLVKVNHPMSFGGYEFYQSNYDPSNPRYSGLEVVHDPGLPLVYLAFWLLMYGVLHTVMLRRWTPWWERRGRSPPERSSPREAGSSGTEVIS